MANRVCHPPFAIHHLPCHRAIAMKSRDPQTDEQNPHCWIFFCERERAARHRADLKSDAAQPALQPLQIAYAREPGDERTRTGAIIAREHAQKERADYGKIRTSAPAATPSAFVCANHAVQGAFRRFADA